LLPGNNYSTCIIKYCNRCKKLPVLTDGEDAIYSLAQMFPRSRPSFRAVNIVLPSRAWSLGAATRFGAGADRASTRVGDY